MLIKTKLGWYRALMALLAWSFIWMKGRNEMKLYVIGGKAKCGKNTFGKFLREELKNYGYKPCVMRLSEPLYSYAKNYFDWDENYDEKPREFLQKMGIEIIKNKLHKEYFLLDRLSEDIEVLQNFFDVFIITDARLIMEFTELKKRYSDVVFIRLSRESYDDGLTDEERTHITETEIEQYQNFNYDIVNRDLEDLRKIAHAIVKQELVGEDVI